MMFWLGYRLVMALLLVVVGKTTSHVASGPHVADVNILLPPKMTNPVEYRLQGSDGCFKWSWDHHDILSVLPEYNSSNHCSTSARLRSIAPYSGRKETAVYAADVYSGIVIRCKVFIDNFSRIQIFHNSIKLDLDGLATLRVRAFDTEDNVFSSLVGLRFMWQLMPETDGLTHHLVQVPLKDSPLSDCGGLCGDLDIQIELENSGVFSDLYVVKGIGIGHEKVSVHLLEPELMHMADNILLTVAEAMSLEPPSPVFVLVGALLQYTLKVIRGNTPQVVTLPSPHHRWSVSNPSFAQVDTMMGLTRALSLGETVVIVEDTRVAGHMQVSSLNVVLPDTLCLYISPWSIDGDPIEGTKAIPSGARWYVVSGYQYLIQMKVFSQGPGSEEIYITESDDVKVFDNQSEYGETFLVSDDIVLEHGWRNSKILKTTSQGLGNLTASLTYFSGNRDTKEVLKVVQEIMVCDQVKFGRDLKNGMSESIILPWAPGVYQEVDLKATGGCAKASSDYKWFSSDMAIVSVSATGVMQAKKPGKATVKVASIFDSFNFDEIVIEVSLPSSIVMLQNFPVETVVGSYLQAAVTMKASNGAYFYKCDAFSSSVNWKAGRESFIVVNATKKTPFLYKLGTVEHDTSFHGSPCSWTYIYASGSGRTMLHATLSKDYQNLDHSLDGPIVLKASSRIAAYPPFVVQQAGDGSQFGGYWYNKDQVEITTQVENLDKLHLVPGTRIDVLLVGGPERWDESIDFIETFEIFDEKHNHARNGVHVHVISGSYGSSYGVLCQTLGSFKLVFKHGNLIGDDHPLPAVAEVSLSLICSYPSSIVLLVDEPDNEHKVIRSAIQADRSPGRVRVTPVTVANGQTIRVAAAGVSSSGEPFANSSSLCLRWELSNCDGLAYWDDAYDSQRSKSSWERFLVLQNESGLCVVRATVAGFCDSKDGRHSAQLLEIAEDVLTDAIRIQLVSTLRVNPEYNLLFFNPAAKANLSIIGGSCFWEAAVNDSQVVEVILPPAGLQCLQLMLSPKGLGTALVTVYDIGLAPPRAASALVQVADVDWIKLVSGEEISLMEGRLQSIDLMAGIDDGSTFDSSQYAYMDIHVHIEDHIVELVDDDAISGPDDGYVSMSSFNIMAKHLGVTTLYVSVLQRSGHEILSQLIKVEVYAPLSIHPPEIFLVPGASYMLALEGGPTIGVYVDYTSMNDGIAKVHRSGQLFAISPGNTTLLATVFGNGDVVICQAYSMVKVGVPSSVILNVQSEQLAVGREMPIHPLFPEGNLFSFYELCRSYNWTIEDEKVLSFGLEQLQCENQGLLSAVSGQPQFFNYLDERELGFIKVLHARSAGRTSVTTAFLCDFVSDSYSQSRIYSASVSLLVVPDLPLALGTLITWVLPPHYTTTALLPSSSDLHGPSDSQSRKGSIVYSLLRMCSEKNVAVNKEDISIDGDRIKTTSSNNLACIQAKDQSTGRIEIASCIRVTEVAQIRISNKEFPSSVIHLAVGAELEIPISYYDALGNPFYEAHNVIFYHVETNYHDIVSINHTLSGSGKVHLKAKRQGRALVQVAINRSRQKSDYILISVGAHIYPQNPLLYVGDGLNFSIEGFSDQVSGHWFSANESVVYVHKPFGKAEAVGIGSTQVFFECPTMKLQTTVTVLSRNIISVDAPKEVLTNVPYPTKGYTFAVRFSDTHKKLKARENNAVSYDCEVDPPFIGYAKPWMDLNTGNLYCLFFPYSPEHLVRSVPKSRDTSPYISISINASLREAHHVSGSASASALFIGGFSILEMDKNSLQLDLTPESNKTTITILGNTGVEIHWHNRDCMKISPVHKEDFGTGGHVQYEVEVVVAKKFKDKIVVTLPANGQRVEVDVNFDTGQREASGSRVKGIASIIGFSALIALILVIIISKLDGVVERSTRSQLTVSPAAASMTTPSTPERSPAVPNEQVLRTPQPFVDYVRRTIDETPYYRRDARRRFNPQNTI